MNWIEPDWPAPGNVRALVDHPGWWPERRGFRRSQPGGPCVDEPARVEANRARLQQAAQIPRASQLAQSGTRHCRPLRQRPVRCGAGCRCGLRPRGWAGLHSDDSRLPAGAVLRSGRHGSGCRSCRLAWAEGRGYWKPVSPPWARTGGDPGLVRPCHRPHGL